MIAIVDYGVGNLFSLQSSFACIGQEAVVTGDPDHIAQAQKIVLPGVGAFADAARKLRQSGLDEAVRFTFQFSDEDSPRTFYAGRLGNQVVTLYCSGAVDPEGALALMTQRLAEAQ